MTCSGGIPSGGRKDRPLFLEKNVKLALFCFMFFFVSSHQENDTPPINAFSYVMTHRILPLDPYDVVWVGGENSGHT